MKPISISVTLENNQRTQIPLVYYVTNESAEALLINCKVDLGEDAVPDGLSLREFIIRRVHSSGVTVTEFSAIPIKTVNDGFLISAAYEQIAVQEKIR